MRMRAVKAAGPAAKSKSATKSARKSAAKSAGKVVARAAPQAFPNQFAIRHKPTGRLKGRSTVGGGAMRDWNPGAAKQSWASEQATAKNNKPKTYASIGSARLALNDYCHDRSELEIVEFAIIEIDTHSPFKKGK